MDIQQVLLTLAETSAEAVLACDLTGEISYANPALAHVSGWTKCQLLGMDCRELFVDFHVLTLPTSPEDPTPRQLNLQEFSTCLRPACGEPLPVSVTVSAVRAGEAITGAVLSIAPERGEDDALVALRQSEANYRTLVEHMLNGLVQYQIILDDDGHPVDAVFCAANAAFEEITGIKRDAVIGMRVTEERPDVDREWVDLLGKVALTGEPVRFERRSERLGKWFSMLAYSPREGFCAIVSEDITARKVAEEELRRVQQQTLTFLDSLPGYAFFKDLQGAYLTANLQFCRAVGRSREELVGRTDRDLFPPELADKYQADDRLVMETGLPLELEEQMVDQGRLLIVATRKVPLLDEAGNSVGLIGLGFDITGRKRAEDNQRLASIGQLASGVAHEFNNLLAAIMMKAELAIFQGDARQYEELAQMVLRSSQRGAAICRNLTAFAGPRALDRETLCLTDAIETALSATVAQLTSAQIKVSRQYGDHAAVLYGDRRQLEQVFINLIINACHAMPDGGTLTVRTECQSSLVGPIISVTVSDTGTGIKPEHLPRVFEPFFTTKGLLGQSDVPGTGLGLSVSHGIVKAHGGRIEVHSERGQGVTVQIDLPQWVEPSVDIAADLGRQMGIAAAARRELRVLLAEDEDDVRELVTRILTDNGCEVLATATTAEALHALAEQEFDLVVADWLMPGGGGREVAAAAKARNNPPPVVVITGRIEPDVNEELLAANVVKLLHKPFHVADLVAVINELRLEIGVP